MRPILSRGLRLLVGPLTLAILTGIPLGLAGCAPRLALAERDALISDLFAPPTEAERAAVLARWEGEAPVPVEGVRVKARTRSRGGGYTLVVSHVVGGHRHFGAVRVPPHARGARLPVLVVTHGGNSGASGYSFFRSGALADGWVQVVPSYRSEPLLLSPLRAYLSEGPSDLWSGDVEDSMALLGAALALVPSADPARVAAMGHSRGGTVALLLALRDPRIRAVVSVAGPTDFFLPQARRVAERGLGYPFARLPSPNVLADEVLFGLRDGRLTVAEARLELLRRSPAYFVDHLPPAQVHHGLYDEKVPYAHAVRIGREASARGVALEAHAYPEGRHRLRTLDGAVERAERFLAPFGEAGPEGQPRGAGPGR